MKKGFTLIELLAVIVVLAILALVVTPIVLNIVENAQRGSDERSLEAYAKVVQSSYYEEKMKDPTLTLEDYLKDVDTPSGVSLTYNGSKVVCSEKIAVETVSGEQTIELRNCTVDGRGSYNFINGKTEYSSSKSFAEDSWSTIIANVKSGNTSAYKVGDTKEITLTSTDPEIAGTYTVRIANMSTPEECNTKKACGFVVEFVDIITMRLRSDGINDIYNAIPSEIKDVAQLYLLSQNEVWGTSETGQLDYYANLGVTKENCSAAIKQYNDVATEWLINSFVHITHSPGNYDIYFCVSSIGGLSGCDTDYGFSAHGVAPAFRIG